MCAYMNFIQFAGSYNPCKDSKMSILTTLHHTENDTITSTMARPTSHKIKLQCYFAHCSMLIIVHTNTNMSYLCFSDLYLNYRNEWLATTRVRT